jgi:hypothetical protein
VTRLLSADGSVVRNFPEPVIIFLPNPCYISVGGKGKNQFGLKYLDTSSLEFGRKIITGSEKFLTTEPSADKSRVTYDSNNKKSQDKTIASSLSVSSSETVQIETSLSNQDLVKPSRVKKRNFVSKNLLTPANILNSHIDSNNFRHTTKSPAIQVETEVIRFN